MDKKDKCIQFTINNQEYKVISNIPIDTTLNTFIRDYAQLKGTKFMCKEGGCGACIVTVHSIDPVTNQEKFYAVNSCLVPVWSCGGQAITTVEGLGDRQKGYHKIQRYLAHFNGTQCGYCTPGMIMNMYSLLKSNPDITMEEVENSFGGNICRCTGYRPILEAFKALASDASEDLKMKAPDIEDIILNGCNSVNGINGTCNGKCTNCPKKIYSTIEKLDKEGNIWYSADSVEDILKVFNENEDESYMLIAGSTAQGVYRIMNEPKLYIDISRVAELQTYKIFDNKIELGANITLTKAMQLFVEISQSNTEKFGYLKRLEEHIDLIANVPVRNIGTLAGNLMIKHAHKIFPSDLFLILETVGAKVLLESIEGPIGPLSLLDFLEHDMNKTVIKRIILPALSSEKIKFRTFKIMPRKQNVHAYVNAGFLFSLNDEDIVKESTIVYGGIREDFVHAKQTESYLKGKCILNSKVFKEGLQILSGELNPDEDPLESSPEYRKNLALSLFYRFVLGIKPEKISDRYKSGIENLKRPLSMAKQIFEVKNKCTPIWKPVRKLEAAIQCSGEAEYVGDMTAPPGQLYGALVLARRAVADLESIDAVKALQIPGVVAFYSAKDIPGKNCFMKKDLFASEDEELFCSGKVLYAGQPVGVIVAETQELAISAAKKVSVTYRNKRKPLLTVKDVLEANETSRIRLDRSMEPTIIQPRNKNVKNHEISGRYELGSQYHFTMETQSSVCVPTDEGLNVYSATQWMDQVQGSIAKMLNIPENSINMRVKRLGGAFGCKITRASLIANACALAAHKLNRPVKIVLDMETNMESIGKRCPILSDFKVNFDDDGKIQDLQIIIYQDVGCSLNDPSAMLIPRGLYNAYDPSTWKIYVYTVTTDNAATAWIRGPGTIEGFSAIENIMEQIAHKLDKDPFEVRMANFNKKYTLLQNLIDTIRIDVDYEASRAEIETFNENNRWKKRGISLIPMVFDLEYFCSFHVMVSIYSGDGTVSVTHGGIEMGQGINTKVAQVVAYSLGIDLDMIKLKASSNLTAPNDGMSGGSITSESCAYAAIKCCEILNKRLQPIKSKLCDAKWPKIIEEAFKKGVDLNASYMYSPTSQEIQSYAVFGVGVSQVEIDLLTGNYQILRTDILEDAGESISPYIDIGQIEGAFVMGLGYFLTEQIKQDPESGMILTNRTWNYWPPGVKDIPIELNIKLAKDAPNPAGVMRSKSTGEPPLCLALSAVTAIRDGLKSARRDSGIPSSLFRLDQPCSAEQTFLVANTSSEQFSF